MNTDLIYKAFTFQVGEMCPLFVVGKVRTQSLRHRLGIDFETRLSPPDRHSHNISHAYSVLRADLILWTRLTAFLFHNRAPRSGFVPCRLRPSIRRRARSCRSQGTHAVGERTRIDRRRAGLAARTIDVECLGSPSVSYHQGCIGRHRQRREKSRYWPP